MQKLKKQMSMIYLEVYSSLYFKKILDLLQFFIILPRILVIANCERSVAGSNPVFISLFFLDCFVA